MPIPVAIIALGLGAVALAAGGGKAKPKDVRPIMTDTLRALKAEDADRTQKDANAFEQAGDGATASALRNVGRRIADSNSGATVAPALSLDPDNSGAPAVAEWAAIVAQSENRASTLRSWADAFKSEGYPGIANILSMKADAIEAGTTPPPIALTPQSPTTTAPVTPGSETPALSPDGSLNVNQDGSSAPAEPGVNVPGPSGPDVSNPDGSTSHADGSVTDQGGTTTYPDGTKTYPTGQTKLPDGTIIPSSSTHPDMTGNAPAPAGFDVQSAVANALATGNAATIAAVAAQLDSMGYHEQAAQLRARVDEINAAAKSAGVPQPRTPTGAPAVKVVQRTYTVRKGDSPWRVAQRFTGNGNRWKDLVKANPTKPINPKTGSFAQFYAGEVLNLPVSWPSTPPSTAAKVAAPVVTPRTVAPVTVAPVVVTPSPMPAQSANYDLAQQMTDNLNAAPIGGEDKTLVKAFQLQEGTAAVGSADGLYGPQSALRVAWYGIIPSKPRYWHTATESADKANYRAQMAQYASKDPVRSSQWLEAGRV
jgi:hypothetical protein